MPRYRIQHWPTREATRRELCDHERSLVRPTELAQLHQAVILRRERDLAPGLQQSSFRAAFAVHLAVDQEMHLLSHLG
jgi:hypothetical protein